MAYLGEIIEKLESVPPDTVLKRSLTNPHSWRGIYEDLAFEPSDDITTTGELAALMRSCLEQTFEGYKGGHFVMHRYSNVRIAHYGNSEDLIWDWLLDFMLGEI